MSQRAVCDTYCRPGSGGPVVFRVLLLPSGAAMTESARRPGPESTLNDVRMKLVDAAIGLLRERGVDLGLAEITLSDAIDRAGVARSTAYRSLADPNDLPQVVLHRELLHYLLKRFDRGDARAAIENAVAEELTRHGELLESGDVAQRTMVMRCVIRRGSNTSYLRLIDSKERSILVALYGAMRSSPLQNDWRRAAVIEGERDLMATFSEMYGSLAAIFQYRVKAPFTMSQFALAGASLIEGLAMRQDFNAELDMIDRPTGPNGASEPWTMFAVGFEALTLAMLEPADPDQPFADLVNH